MGHNAAVYAAALSPDEASFFSVAGDGWLVNWSLSTPQSDGKLSSTNENIPLYSVCTNRKNCIITGDMNGALHWIDRLNAEHNKHFFVHKKGVYFIHTFENLLLTGGGDGILAVWDFDKKEILHRIRVSHVALRCIASASTLHLIAIGSSDGNISIFDTRNWSLVHRIENAHQLSVFSLAFDVIKGNLVSGGRDAKLNVWDIDSWQLKQTIDAHWFTVNSVAFCPNFKILATGSRDKTIRLWDAHTFSLLRTIDTMKDGGHLRSVNHVIWSDENHLISCSDDRSVILWNILF